MPSHAGPNFPDDYPDDNDWPAFQPDDYDADPRDGHGSGYDGQMQGHGRFAANDGAAHASYNEQNEAAYDDYDEPLWDPADDYEPMDAGEDGPGDDTDAHRDGHAETSGPRDAAAETNTPADEPRGDRRMPR